MATPRFSRRAKSDLASIVAYTIDAWSEEQAWVYLDRIEACCQLLAKTPYLGRSCREISAGMRRFEEGRHVIFYEGEDGGIFIARILHQGMLAQGFRDFREV